MVPKGYVPKPTSSGEICIVEKRLAGENCAVEPRGLREHRLIKPCLRFKLRVAKCRFQSESGTDEEGLAEEGAVVEACLTIEYASIERRALLELRSLKRSLAT